MSDAQYGYSSGNASVANPGYGAQYNAYGADTYGSYSSSGSNAPNYGSASAPNPYAQQSGYQSTANDQYSGYSTQPQQSLYSDGQPQQSGYYSTGGSGGAPNNSAQSAYSSNSSYGTNSYYTSQHGASHPSGGQQSGGGQYGQYGSAGGNQYGSGGGGQSNPSMGGFNIPPTGMTGGPTGPYSGGQPNSHYGSGGGGSSMGSHGPQSGFHDGMGGSHGMRGPPNNNFRGGHGGGRNSGPGFMKGRGGFGGPPDHFGHQDSNQDTVFISGLPDDISEDQLVSHFGSIGVIKIDKKTGKPKIWIYRDKISGKGKGEATLTYDDPHTAKSAINWFNGKECGGKIIKVEFAQRKPGIGGDRGGGGGGGFGGGNPGRGFRGGGSRGSDRGGPRGASDGGGRQGDWRCPVQSCNNNNFSWRNECNRCKAPRPGDGGGAESFSTPQVVESSQRRGGGMAGRGRGGGGSRGMGGRGSRGGGPPRGPPGGRGGGGGRGGPMRSDFSDRRSKPY